MTRFFQGFRRDAHPMAVMVGSVGALSAFYHDVTDITDPKTRMIASMRLIAKLPTLAAMAYKYTIGQPFVYPNNSLDYSANFLNMCFAVPCEEYEVSGDEGSRASIEIFILSMPTTSKTRRPRPFASRDRPVPIRSPASPRVSPASGDPRTVARTRQR